MNSSLLGKTLLMQYRVDQHIASTNMSDVFKVWDIHRNVPLAMKVLNSDLAEDPSMLKRFKREAQALKKLKHPNIVPFYGLYDVEDFYFLLESFIDGPNLKDILRQQPNHQMKVADALIFLKAVCAGLGYAHTNGVVHCDIKPGNVMVDQGGTIYLTDFGIARHSDSSTTTMAGAGTAAYMAPEQILEETVTPATDVYALGIMLFEMLAGRRPFRGDDEEVGSIGRSTNERLRNAHLKIAPPDPRQFRPDLPKAFADAILKALSKKPEDRQNSALQFFSDICAAAEVSPEGVKDRVVPSGEIKAPLTPNQGIGGKTKAATRLPVWAWMVGAVIVVVIVTLSIGPLTIRETQITEAPDAVTQQAVPATDSPFDPTQPAAPPASPSATASPVSPEPPTVAPAVTETPDRAFDDTAELIHIPTGEFTMGLTQEQISILCRMSEKCDPELLSYSAPAHKVFLSEYWIYRTEVTNAQYALCVDAGKCTSPNQFSQYKVDSYFRNPAYNGFPVVHVDWYQADQYCRAAGGRLPTEAEWEKAARGNDGRLWPWGNENPQDRHANLSDTNLKTIDGTTEVGRFSPAGDSPYGLADMAGNVYEWVSDWYSYTYFSESPFENPQGPSQSNRYNGEIPARVVKGGSSGFQSWAAASGVHDMFEPQDEGHAVGFRCVRTGP